MKTITKAAFLEADDLPLTSVKLPKVYGEDMCLYVRTLRGDEKSVLEKRYMNRNAADDPGDFRGTILILCIVDETGKPVFAEADRNAVMSKSSSTLETLFERACELNGFREKDVEALEKN